MPINLLCMYLYCSCVYYVFFCLMILRPPRSTLTDTLFPYTTLFRSEGLGWVELGRGNVISNQDIKNVPGNFPIYSSSVKNNGHMGSYGRYMFDEELISWSVDGGGDFFNRTKHKFSITTVSGYMRLAASRLNYKFMMVQLNYRHTKK